MKHKQGDKQDSQFKKIVISKKIVRDVLGVEVYDTDEYKHRIMLPGIALGLAWTAAGGKLLMIEVIMN